MNSPATNDKETASWITWAGLIGAPLAALAVYWLLPDSSGLTHAGRATAAVAVLMATLWLTEALPLPATSLLPILLFPFCDVLSIKDATAPYANKYIFLFMGGFMLALAMERWNLHRRVALMTILAVGTSPTHLIAGMMLATTALSMWISNTATTVLMLPIGLSLVSLLFEQARGESSESDTSQHAKQFAVCLMLGIAYAASIGGLGTIVGSPPNLYLASYVRANLPGEIGFGRWMLVGVPLALVFVVIAWFMLTYLIYPIRMPALTGGKEMIRQQLRDLGPMSRGEKIVLAVFVTTAVCWVIREPLTKWSWLVEKVPPVGKLDDAGIAIAAALLLFAIPVDLKRATFTLDWHTAKKLPWGVLLLFGGGLSLAEAFQSSGLSRWIGGRVSPLDGMSPFVVVAITTAMVILLTELTSNTATATTFFPILGSVAVGLDINPILLLLPAGLAANCAFIMPVATPPNAIVFGSGHIKLRQMVRAGIWLNIVGLMLVLAFTYLAVSLGIL